MNEPKSHEYLDEITQRWSHYLLATALVQIHALQPSPRHVLAPARSIADYFSKARRNLNVDVLRPCQREALQALTNYFVGGVRGRQAACVMGVSSGKTVLGIAATSAFTHQRAMIVTPVKVIRRTFDRALSPREFGNALHHLPLGPLIPNCRVPSVLVLDREGGDIRDISRKQLLAAEILVTNYHSLGDGSDPGDLLTELQTDDIDFSAIDEAHNAAAPSQTTGSFCCTRRVTRGTNCPSGA